MPDPKPKIRRPLRVHLFRLAVVVVLIAFLALNVCGFLLAHAMTHYAAPELKTTRIRDLTGWTKTRVILAGPTIRRMVNTNTPANYGMRYTTEQFPGAFGLQLEAWRIATTKPGPVVLLFPGYGASKDTTLAAAQEFHAMGCETWLVDFHGIGGSGGDTTTIGYSEAEDVAATVRKVNEVEPKHGPLVLYGTSMGAASILCAIHRGLVQPDALVLECPFDRFGTTLGNRFGMLGLPRFPLLPTVLFWTSVMHRFNAFNHDPMVYARSVRCPTLLYQGDNDQFVGLQGGKNIASALGQHCEFHLLPGCGHAYLVRGAPQVWKAGVRTFFAQNVPRKN